MDSLEMIASWPARAEDLDACAGRFHGFLASIGEASGLYRRWIPRRKSPVRRLGPEPQVEDARALLAAGVNRTDFGHEPIPDLGFSAGLWNGTKIEGEAASLRVHCGAYGSFVSNSVTLDLPARLLASGGVPVVRTLLGAAIRCWEPESACVGNYFGLWDAQGKERPLVGPLTYLSREAFALDEAAAAAAGAGIADVGPGWLLEMPLDSPPEAVFRLRSVFARR